VAVAVAVAVAVLAADWTASAGAVALCSRGVVVARYCGSGCAVGRE
jgi:hypothetical protein